jgi:hypothetical protein
MPAVICYVHVGDGREVQMRVRFSQRVAIPIEDMPKPPAGLLLICSGFSAALRLVGVTNGFAVYYISSVDYDYLIDLISRLCAVEPCRLPCVLTAPQPPASPTPT